MVFYLHKILRYIYLVQYQPKFLLLFIVFCIMSHCRLQAQQGYWQQRVDYTIQVSLDDKEKVLTAEETIRYTNNSPDTLYYIPFHIWANAYKNDQSAFSEQLLRNGHTAFYFAGEEQRGYIKQLAFRVNGVAANIAVDSTHADIITLLLPQPLYPGQTIVITTPFHEKLPYNFSRGGYEGETFQVTQWYPKPAVYDSKGWHPMPYLDLGEFYSEFGDFDVTITLPQNYIVAASGKLQNEEELEKLKTLGRQNPQQQSNFLTWHQSLRQEAIRNKKPFVEVMPSSSASFKTLRYQLSNAHDFAWFASKLFLVQYDTIQLGNQSVDAFTFCNPWDKRNWQNSLRYVKDGVHFYSDKLGEYPYNVVSAVLGNSSKEGGGMEYPTITLLEMSDSGEALDATIVHEVGHNWLYGILASNERDHAWMDEGINTYYENRYIHGKYRSIAKKTFINNKLPAEEDTLLLATLHKLGKDQPINLTADSLTEMNYALSVYSKGSMWMKSLEKRLGTSLFDSSMHDYFNQWKFKHPYPPDFKKNIERVSGFAIDSLYQQLYTTGSLYSTTQKQLKLTGLFNLKNTVSYRYISLAPAAGYNYYDGLMIGGLIHNYQLPINNFNFLIAPLYATQSKQWNGAARFSYSIFSKQKWLEFAISGLRYNINAFAQYNGDKLFFTLNRIVPSIKYRLYNKDLRSTQRWTFLLKSFILKEENFGDFTTVTSPTDTFYVANKKSTSTTLGQLNMSVSDNRKLYPYDATLTVDAGKTFLRAGFTGNYFFNYRQEGQGIGARLFAGKFFYMQQKTLLSKSENDRYLLTLTGPRGYEDFTYIDYFAGRNEHVGGLSQQLMQRDGFFKVGTPLLNSPVGKTDNWLMALNVWGDIPEEINPLKVLPFKLPVQLFADIGTYSDAWKDDNNSDRFLFDAGLKISIVHSAFNVYLPLVYSKVFRDYYKTFYQQKKFARTIAFSFDLQQLQPNKLNRRIPL